MYIVGAQNNTIYQYSTGVTTTQLNRMDKTQLDAVADANHFTLGNSLDLMIALRMDTAASTLPTSDGVTLNYDAAVLNEGAVLGTDYDFFFPANNKVQIKSSRTELKGKGSIMDKRTRTLNQAHARIDEVEKDVVEIKTEMKIQFKDL